MERRKVLDEGRQLKRMNAETRRQSHFHKWFAIVAALYCLLIIFYDRDMRSIIFSAGVCIACTYMWLKGRYQARRYRRQWNEQHAKNIKKTTDIK